MIRIIVFFLLCIYICSCGVKGPPLPPIDENKIHQEQTDSKTDDEEKKKKDQVNK